LIRVWKSVEKPKFIQRKEERGKNSVPPRGRLEAGVDWFGLQGQDAEDAFVDAA